MSLDQEAAYRMIRLSGQQGVPVITVDDDVVVGFNRGRLEELLSRKSAGKPRLGAAVADAAPRLQVEGAYVSRVTKGSPTQRWLAAPGVVVHSQSALNASCASRSRAW